jgi:hypothetical protein
MFHVALLLVLAAPIGIMAWVYVRVELQLRTQDRVCRDLEHVGDFAFEALIDLADDRPFGIKAPRIEAVHSESLSLSASQS